MMDKSLLGKRALITGSSRGIGRAIALSLAEAGADIVLHYAGNAAAAKETAEKIAALGVRVQTAQADLSAVDGAETLWKQVGDIDLLILNASVQIKKPWESISDADFDTQINCNLRSSLKLIQLAVPHMREKGEGRIITIGSVQEAKPHPDMLVYAASKAAQTMLVKSLAAQLAPDHITVNNVAPGVIYTDRNRDALADAAYAQKVMESIPLGFYGQPEDCAGVVRLLCGAEGRYITGQSIFIDGGKSL